MRPLILLALLIPASLLADTYTESIKLTCSEKSLLIEKFSLPGKIQSAGEFSINGGPSTAYAAGIHNFKCLLAPSIITGNISIGALSEGSSCGTTDKTCYEQDLVDATTDLESTFSTVKAHFKKGGDCSKNNSTTHCNNSLRLLIKSQNLWKESLKAKCLFESSLNFTSEYESIGMRGNTFCMLTGIRQRIADLTLTDP